MSDNEIERESSRSILIDECETNINLPPCFTPMNLDRYDLLFSFAILSINLILMIIFKIGMIYSFIVIPVALYFVKKEKGGQPNGFVEGLMYKYMPLLNDETYIKAPFNNQRVYVTTKRVLQYREEGSLRMNKFPKIKERELKEIERRVFSLIEAESDLTEEKIRESNDKD